MDLSDTREEAAFREKARTWLEANLPKGVANRGFALAIVFGIIVGTSSSIFIASPILLFLGEKRLRPRLARPQQPALAVKAEAGGQ